MYYQLPTSTPIGVILAVEFSHLILTSLLFWALKIKFMVWYLFDQCSGHPLSMHMTLLHNEGLLWERCSNTFIFWCLPTRLSICLDVWAHAVFCATIHTNCRSILSSECILYVFFYGNAKKENMKCFLTLLCSEIADSLAICHFPPYAGLLKGNHIRRGIFKWISLGGNEKLLTADAALNNVYKVMGFLRWWAESMPHQWKRSVGKRP